MNINIQNHYTLCAEKEAPAGHLLFKPWIAGIAHRHSDVQAAQPPMILHLCKIIIPQIV